jgi:hypothetical protein
VSFLNLREVRAAWLNQPEEDIPVDIEHIHRRRTWELFSTTRSKIISRIGAALFFSVIVAWRFASERDRLVLLWWGDRVGGRNAIPVSQLNQAPRAPIGRRC